MLTKQIAVIGLGIMMLFLISACAPQQSTIPSNTPEPVNAATSTLVSTTPAVPAVDSAAAIPTVDMDALIKEKVAGHHDLDRIYNAHKTREEWNATLDRMIQYGAQISEEEKTMIIDYLLSR
jgi:hypothetical protein